jgi:hypothetical protein
MSAVSLLERRRILELRIEEAIALLDLIDGDPDLEENGDEHDVGTPLNWCVSSLWNTATISAKRLFRTTKTAATPNLTAMRKILTEASTTAPAKSSGARAFEQPKRSCIGH